MCRSNQTRVGEKRWFCVKRSRIFSYTQWCWTAECVGGARAPALLQMACHEGHSRANKKLTILYSPSQKRSPKRLIVLVEPKSGRGTGHDKNIFPARTWHVPPLFKLVPMSLAINASPCVHRKGRWNGLYSSKLLWNGRDRVTTTTDNSINSEHIVRNH